jgi:hypothetical protein
VLPIPPTSTRWVYIHILAFLVHVHALQFFLRGTQLSQLSEEYDACLDNINQTKKVLHQKKQVLPDLRATFKEASVRFEEASKAREQRCKVDELKKELAWAHVAAKQAVRTDPLDIPPDPCSVVDCVYCERWVDAFMSRKWRRSLGKLPRRNAAYPRLRLR